MKTRFSILVIFSILLICVGCTDSGDTPPSGPEPPPTSHYTVSVSADPSENMVGGNSTISAVIKKDGEPLSDESAKFTTSHGYFIDSNSKTILKKVTNGLAEVTLTADSLGQARVTVSIGDGSGYATVYFSEDVFFVTSIEPSEGYGGEQAVIKGVGFDLPLKVDFGTASAEILGNTTSTITVIVPRVSLTTPTQDLPVDVVVTRRAGGEEAEEDTIEQGFTFLHTQNQPDCWSISPRIGPNEGQTIVTILGDGFDCSKRGDNTGVVVTFNDYPAEMQTCEEDKLVVLTPPAWAVGVESCDQDVQVAIKNVEGDWTTNCTESFHYGDAPVISAWSQSEGDYTGGDLVIIYGHHFACDHGVTVSFAGVAAQVISCADSEIVARTGAYNPAGQCADNIGEICVGSIVCVSNGCSDNDEAWAYRVPDVFITDIINPNLPVHTPPYLDHSGVMGDIIDIYGRNFLDPAIVTFCGQNETIAIVDLLNPTTHLQAEVPPFSGNYDQQDCIDVDGCDGVRAQPTACDIEVENYITGCSGSIRNGFWYLPPFQVDSNGDLVLDEAACVVDMPDCNITMEPPSPALGGGVSVDVAFMDDSNGCVTTRAWTLRQGGAVLTTSTNAYFTYSFTVPGTYDVELCVTNNYNQNVLLQPARCCPLIFTVGP